MKQAPNTKQARIMIADDHSLFREGALAVLAPKYQIIGAVSDGRQLVECALSAKPDLILLDISMPLLNGIEAAHQIKAKLPEVKLLFLSMHSEWPFVHRAFDAAADGYVLKSAPAYELLDAVERVLHGHLYVSAEIRRRSPPIRGPVETAESLTLSARQREILQLIAEGRSAKEIAHILRISVKTVSFHKENIKHKLGVTSTAELTRNAIAAGLS